MLKIQTMFDQMKEELDGAEGYVCLVTKIKDKDRSIAEMYINMAKNEVEHFTRIYELACKLQESGDIETMHTDIFEWLCDKILMQAARVKFMVDSYK